MHIYTLTCAYMYIHLLYILTYILWQQYVGEEATKPTNQQTKGAKLFRDLNDKYFAFDDKPTSKQSFLKK